MKYFSSSTLGFYDDLIHFEKIPSDSIPISDENYRDLLDAQTNGKVIKSDGVNPILAEPEIDSNLIKKATRDNALQQLTHDFGDGRVMQTRPQDEQNIRNAIEIMTAQSLPSINWVMQDNVKYPVTSAELQAALQAGQLAAMAIWDEYTPE